MGHRTREHQKPVKASVRKLLAQRGQRERPLFGREVTSND